MTNSNNNNQKPEIKPEKPTDITPAEMLESYAELYSQQPDKTKENKYSAKQIDTFLSECEVGDAEMYIDIFKDRFVYDHISKDWYYWNDHYWRMDIIGERFAAIKEVREIYQIARFQASFSKQSAESKKDHEEVDRQKLRIKLLSDRISRLGESPYFSRVITTAANGLGSLGIAGDNWDKQTKILVVKNGCIDLTTGKFAPGKPTDYMRTYCPVSLTPENKDYSIWENFLLSSQSGDVDSVKFIQKLLGYSILGTCEYHIFPIMYGLHGRNGKSTIFEVLFEALGVQMYKLPNDFLIKKRAQKSDGAPDSVLMGMQGKKIIWASELDKGDQFDLPKVKGFTGGDTVSARAQRAKHQVMFAPTWLLWQLTNRLAHVDSSDEAFWQRAVVIPFFKSFVQNPKKDYEELVDLDLKAKLQEILPAIVRWIVEGSLLYQAEGLEPYPAAIQAATREYREGEDRIREFIDEHYTINKDGYVSRSEMFGWYRDWCEDSGYQKLGKKNFYKDIERRFGKNRRIGNEFYFDGLFAKSSYG